MYCPTCGIDFTNDDPGDIDRKFKAIAKLNHVRSYIENELSIADLKVQAISRKVRRLNTYKCSVCGFQMGYIINEYASTVTYDNGCKCSTSNVVTPASCEHVLAFMKHNADSNEHVKYFDKVFGIYELLTENLNKDLAFSLR